MKKILKNAFAATALFCSSFLTSSAQTRPAPGTPDSSFGTYGTAYYTMPSSHFVVNKWDSTITVAQGQLPGRPPAAKVALKRFNKYGQELRTDSFAIANLRNATITQLAGDGSMVHLAGYGEDPNGQAQAFWTRVHSSSDTTPYTKVPTAFGTDIIVGPCIDAGVFIATEGLDAVIAYRNLQGNITTQYYNSYGMPQSNVLIFPKIPHNGHAVKLNDFMSLGHEGPGTPGGIVIAGSEVVGNKQQGFLRTQFIDSSANKRDTSFYVGQASEVLCVKQGKEKSQFFYTTRVPGGTALHDSHDPTNPLIVNHVSAPNLPVPLAVLPGNNVVFAVNVANKGATYFTVVDSNFNHDTTFIKPADRHVYHLADFGNEVMYGNNSTTNSFYNYSALNVVHVYGDKKALPTTGVKQLANTAVQNKRALYPNPAQEDVFIKYEDPTPDHEESLEIFTINGQLSNKQNVTISNGKGAFKTNLNNGIYMLKSTNQQNGEVRVEKLQIAR